MNYSDRDLNRFLSKIEKTPTCWLWKGHVSPKGYGVFWLKDRALRAHRFSCEVLGGKKLGELFCCHKCDVPGCVNPDHLFPGTNGENIKDAFDKGRLKIKNPSAKLTWESVEKIRASRKKPKDLAIEHGVSELTIYNVRAKRIWITPAETTPERKRE